MIVQHVPIPTLSHKSIKIKILQRYPCILFLPFLLHTAHAQTVSTYAGSGTPGFMNGAAASAQFSFPTSVCSDAAGNIYVADANNNRIRKIDGSGNVTTFAGSGTPGFMNGATASAQFDLPIGVCSDAAGNIYVADASNNRIKRHSGRRKLGIGYVADASNNRIRKIDGSGNVTTLAGTVTAGFMEGAAATAQFATPAGACSDATGNIYVADLNNHRIRRIGLSAPSITSFTPTSGGAGTTIIITGSGFTGATAVSFGNVPAAYFAVNSARKSLLSSVVELSVRAGSSWYW